MEPGEYYAAAWEEINAALAAKPDFLAAFTSQAGEIKLAESGQANASLKPIGKDKIAAEAGKVR